MDSDKSVVLLSLIYMFMYKEHISRQLVRG